MTFCIFAPDFILKKDMESISQPIRLRQAMKRSIEDTSIVMVGAGNVGTHLARAFYRKGFRILQVYSRTPEAARALAQEVEADPVTDFGALTSRARLFVVALADDALVRLIPQMTLGREDALWVHTAGSVPMDVWAGHAAGYGVFYPMQTFSKRREVDFRQVPVFVEGCDRECADLLRAVAGVLSTKVYEATSEQRRYLHLGAVLACNFANHLYALASDLLARHGLPFDALLPLIAETARKVHELSPREAQTGPAARGDRSIMDEHLRLLADDPYLTQVYTLLSQGIEGGRP